MNNEQNNMLSKLEKVPTQVPNDLYFETLKKQVVGKLENEPKIVPFYRKKWLQAAASILLLIGIGSVYLLNSKEPVPVTKHKVDFSSLSKDDIINYIENNQEDFDERDLASALIELPALGNAVQVQSKQKISGKEAELEKMWNDLEDEDILEYLKEESDDLDEELIFGS
jgi:hypothetical protein